MLSRPSTLLTLSSFLEHDIRSHEVTCNMFDNYFLKAQRLRQCICDDFMCVFCVPNLLARLAPNDPGDPSTVYTAPHFDEQTGLGGYLQDVLTVPASLRVSRR